MSKEKRSVIGMNYSGEIYEQLSNDLLTFLVIYWSPNIVAGVRVRDFKENTQWVYAKESDVPKEFLAYCLLMDCPCVFYED